MKNYDLSITMEEIELLKKQILTNAKKYSETIEKINQIENFRKKIIHSTNDTIEKNIKDFENYYKKETK